MSTNYKLDTDQRVHFYEQEFYVLSNFSSFQVKFGYHTFMTSEHAYHYAKFAAASKLLPDTIKAARVADEILFARSAHDAFIIAQTNKAYRRYDWDDVKVDIMREILRAKVSQHEYVRRKLLQTGDRELVEDSWRDDYWGWGPNHDGKNMLGRLWMEIREELREHNLLV